MRKSGSLSTRKRWIKRAFGVGLLIVLCWLGALGWFTQQTYAHLQATRQLVAQPDQQTPLAVCIELQHASQAASHARSLALPMMPLLRNLGWIPRFGSILEAMPALADTATAAQPVLQEACRLVPDYTHLLEVSAERRVAEAINLLQTHPPDWVVLQTSLAQFHAAWSTIPPHIFDHSLLQAYPQLKQLDQQLAASQSTLALLQATVPALPVLFGLEQPQTFLLALQNPGELRPTGGFIGSVALITIHNGQIISSTFKNTGELHAQAPPGSTMPRPYNDYLRASIWTLRDANWWPDWPTSAQTLDTFWQLNQQPAPDGLIALDLYAFEALLDVFESIDVVDYGLINSPQGLEDVYGFYESPASINGDKAFLGQLFQTMVEQLDHISPSQVLELASVWYAALQERHISVFIYDQPTQAIFAAHGWDGAQNTQAADLLQIVDADLSYSDVFMFIEQQIALDIWVDQAPFTHTLALTYANRYSEWSAATTQHRVFGYCYNPATKQQERIPGCLGDYIRIYLPPATVLTDHTSAAKIDIERTSTHTIVGTYLLLYPGQTEALSFTYTLPSATTAISQLQVLKQAGTLAHPFVLQSHSSGTTTTYATDLRYTRVFTFNQQAISSQPQATHPRTPEYHQRLAQQTHGWWLWNNQDTQTALTHWQTSNTLNAALDQVNYLHWSDQITQASSLLANLEPGSDQAARAAYLQGVLAEIQGDPEAAEHAYMRSHKLAPDHPAPAWALALLAEQAHNTSAMLDYLKQMAEPQTFLQQQAFDERFRGNYAAADQYQALSLTLDPTNTAASEERYWLNRYGFKPPRWETLIEISEQALQHSSTPALWYARRAEAYTWLEQWQQATQDWQQVVKFEPANAPAWYQLGHTHLQSDDPAAAIAAWQQSTRLQPDSSVLVQLAQLYTQQDQTEAARATYTQALKQDPARQDIRTLLEALGD